MIFMILGAPCGATTFLLLGLGFRVEVYVLCFRFEGCLVKNIAFSNISSGEYVNLGKEK